MNFNLISPSTNGNDYTINFRDPITIPRNSKITTNWIELKRDADIVLEQDATIDITSTKCLPTHIPATPATENSIAMRIDIPRDIYEFESFIDYIEGQINDAINATNKLGRYASADRENNNNGGGADHLENDGLLGIVLDVTDYDTFPSLDTNNAHDDEQTTTGGDVVAYTTHNNTGTFDNYALLDDKFDFYRANCPKDQGEQNSFALFESIDNIEDQTGKLCFALYGKEYADGIGGAPPTRTTGNNPPVLVNSIPTAFVSVILGAQNDHFEIYIAENAGGNTIDTWVDQNQEISNMALIERIPTTTIFNPAGKYNVLFGMEVSNTTDTPSLRWKIASYQDGAYKLIYDSEPQRRNLPFKLLVGDTTTYDNTTALNSQIPFVFMLSATNADEGFENISQTRMPAGSDAEPETIMRDYQITASDNLVLALGMKNDGIYTDLYPNGCQDKCNVIDLNLDINWRSKNYSIFINLPTNNYKNVEEKRDGGFKKSILANIPVPFTTGFDQSQRGTNAGVVTSTYIPYNPIVSYLQNNEIQTNSISIKIVDMLTEEPATEIDRSIVNFTIEPPN
tara:strand:- start:569 stop:2272 length:1704 start_codon:yes stop_codon:yes gene_type:complete